MRPERILQFGEGNFLRAFVDWMIDGMNRQGLFDGAVVVVQPIQRGLVHKLNEQGGRYTLALRGLENGQPVERRTRIESISRGLDPYVDFDAFLACASNPELRFIVSNTTEAGIAVNHSDRLQDRPPASFPGKLTAFLYRRWQLLPENPFILLPCELIDRNGDNLRAAVLETAGNWRLEDAFLEWVAKKNIFTNTLVDRIVPGYAPLDLPYKDELVCTAELFHFWAIEAPESVQHELKLCEAGFDVVWTNDLKPYRDRKVRLLNGAHTGMALAAFLAGKNTVGECMQDSTIRTFVQRTLYDEVIPGLTLPEEDLRSFANSVLERFSNPYIEHKLLSIALNSVSKYKARVLPSVEAYAASHGTAPPLLSVAMAALIVFYRGTEIVDGALIGDRNGEPYRILDDASVLQRFTELWRNPDSVVDGVLRSADWWGGDLRLIPDFSQNVTNAVESILRNGAATSLSNLTAGHVGHS